MCKGWVSVVLVGVLELASRSTSAQEAIWLDDAKETEPKDGRSTTVKNFPEQLGLHRRP